MKPISARIAAEVSADEWQVKAAIDLLDGGATVPFIARYRKEATGALDDVQLRLLEERLTYMRELDARREAILRGIDEQGKLDAPLRHEIDQALTKARLEDLYQPFKPRHRSKAQTAREAGLQPLADSLLADPTRDPDATAAAYVDAEKGVPTPKDALDGARAILIERFSEDPELIGGLRESYWNEGLIVSKLRDGKAADGAKFSDYFDFSEPLRKLPSHRILALFRGEKEEVLELTFLPSPPGDPLSPVPDPLELRVARRFGVSNLGRPADAWLASAVRLAWKVRIQITLQGDIRMRLRDAAETEAVRVFAGNLRDLLLAAPAGAAATMGLDPGYRTGVKVAVVDATGKVLATETIFPHEPQRRWDESLSVLTRLARVHRVGLVAVGNGTASRETDKLAGELVQRNPDLKMTKAMVSEAGASIYSASAYASQELPDLDVTLRGAVSIARRLQDPLAELVKIDPKSIGVGQYQHDIDEYKLSRSLDAVVEDCVNAVGVDVNTASVPLLARVSGIGPSLAQDIVLQRDVGGPFRTREDLRRVNRLGPRAFELSAGFLRILDGDDPLDRSGVHPESYPVVHRISAITGKDARTLIGNAGELRRIRPEQIADADFGIPTVTDILKELEKPGRDPRPTFRTATFKDGVESLGQVRPGMLLEGVVTNVAAFGAFVDIGVHQDGLVHVSALSKEFVKDPRDVVRPGQVVRCKVLSVDAQRKRISLTLRLDDPIEDADPMRRSGEAQRQHGRADRSPPAGGGAMAAALLKAGQRKGGSIRK